VYADNEFDQGDFKAEVEKSSGNMRPSRSKSSKQHGCIERVNRTVQQRVRKMLRSAGLCSLFWNLALGWYVVPHNFYIPVRARGAPADAPLKTPFEHRYGHPPPVPAAPPKFFAPIYYIDDAKYDAARQRFGDRSSLGFFAGVDRGRKSWTIVSRPGQTELRLDKEKLGEYTIKSANYARFIPEAHLPPVYNDAAGNCAAVEEDDGEDEGLMVLYGKHLTEQRAKLSEHSKEACATENANASATERTDACATHDPKACATGSDSARDDAHDDECLLLQEVQQKYTQVPPHLAQYAEEEIAKHKKYEAIEDATDKEVENARKKKKLMKASFYHKVKRSGKNKMRLCSQGFKIGPLKGYADNATNMSSWDVVMVFLSYSQWRIAADVENGIPLDSPLRFVLALVDVVSAYLQASLGLRREDQPVIVSQFGAYRCVHAVNGLKESGKAWQNHRDGKFKKIGLDRCTTEPSVFAKNECRLCTHVDDFLTGGPRGELRRLIGEISGEMELTEDTGIELAPGVLLFDLLGAELIVDYNKGRIALGSQQYLDKGLLRLGKAQFTAEGAMVLAEKANALPPRFEFHHLETVERDEPTHERFRAQGILGFAVYRVRRELSFSMKQAASSRSNARAEAIIGELLKSAATTRLFVLDGKHLARALGNYVETDPTQVVVLTDSDYASDPNTRRSIGGTIVSAFGNPVVQLSENLGVVDSSTAAELYAGHKGKRKRVAIEDIAAFFLRPAKTKKSLQLTDSEAGLKMIKSAKLTDAAKHIGVRVAYLRQDAEEDLADQKWIPRNLNTADFFTHITPTLKETWSRMKELGYETEKKR
jgi:hypothetical protein